MMCDRYSSQINELTKGSVDERTTDQITQHIASCPACEAEFDGLFDAREVFASVLSAFEPANSLTKGFLARLENEPTPTMVRGRLGLLEALSNAFTFFRLNTASATAFVLTLFLFGTVFIYEIRRSSSAVSEVGKVQNAPLEHPSAITPQPKDVEEIGRPANVDSKDTLEIRRPNKTENKVPRLIRVRNSIVRTTDPANGSQKGSALDSEQMAQIAQMQKLDVDAARQIEKVEILFRSFRNSRPTEETGRYDLDYEKQQARKLLSGNISLKKRAERYGTILAEQLLNEVEPHLLDIANMENSPSAEQVGGIKDRFRNKQIISSLQGYSIR